ncbi:hypothetical protein Shyhy01_04250 [Streptomyces hygroscopicus subsp. hygroscopicus]|nr:hypothetical protein Shyhy01_04250 [Streptomyces hygroscopicus subsp. hygroscopicus]
MPGGSAPRRTAVPVPGRDRDLQETRHGVGGIRHHSTALAVAPCTGALPPPVPRVAADGRPRPPGSRGHDPSGCEQGDPRDRDRDALGSAQLIATQRADSLRCSPPRPYARL